MTLGLQAAVGVHRHTAAADVGPLLGDVGAALTLLAEADFLRSKTSVTTQKGLIAFAEADVTVTPGVDLIASMDSYDPDTDLKTGSVSRFSFGVACFPLSGVEIRPIYRFTKKENVISGTDLSTVPENELHILFHLYL